MLWEALREKVSASIEKWRTGARRKRRLEEVRELVEAAIRPQATWLVIEQVAEKLLDPAGRPPRAITCPRGGATATFARRRTRRLETTVGELRFQRSVYECNGHCQTPADDAIGIRPGESLSPWLEQLTSGFGTELPFARAQQMLAKTTVETAAVTSTVHETTIDVGRTAEAAMLERSRAIRRRCPPDAPRIPDPARVDDTLVIEPDGAFCPTLPGETPATTTTGNPARQQPPAAGPAPATATCAAARSTTCAIASRSRRRARASRAAGRCCAASGAAGSACHWMEFAWLLDTLSLPAGVGEAKRVVVLGDGAQWIDWMTRRFFPGAIRILDFWHAAEHVATVGHMALGVGTPAFTAWFRTQRRRLREGQVPGVIAAIRALGRGRVDAALREAIRREVQYPGLRVAQMDYPRFVAMGLPIGSGLIEGHNGHIVKNRLDAGGMRWHPEHANSLLSLICETRNAEAAARNAA